MADATPATPKPEDDPFAAAFAEFSKPEAAGEPAADPVLDGAAVLEAGKAPAQIEIEGALPDPKAVAADGKTPDAPAEPPADAPAAGGKTPDAPAADKAPAAQTLTPEEMARFREFLAAKPPVAPAPEPAKEERPAVQPFSPQENEVVETYKREWPDVFMAEQLIRRQEYQALASFIFSTIAPHLQAVQQQTGQIATQTHLERLQAAVPDYAEVSPKVVDWIDKQPDYLRDGYRRVAQQGSVEQVVDMINRYRAETGAPAPAARQAPVGASAAPPAAPLAPPSKVVKGLAPVATKRTGVQTDAIAPDNFDAAFDAFSKSL